MKKMLTLIIAMLMGGLLFGATALVSDVSARQRYPWNGLVDIDYTVIGDATDMSAKVTVEDREHSKTYQATKFISPIDLSEGRHRITWDLKSEGVDIVSSKVSIAISLLSDQPQTQPLYYVIDLSAGKDAERYPVTTLSAEPAGGWTDEYKTTKLVLRRLEAGSYMMGERATYFPDASDFRVFRVTLTKPFYIGVFEVTQRQWELVMGTRPSYFKNDTCYMMRPVERVNYNMIRGEKLGAGWPNSSAVDATSFMGKLRERTGIMLDLPTEGQWEYACRAGTTTALNNGTNIPNRSRLCSNLSELARYNGCWVPETAIFTEDDYAKESSPLRVGTAAVGSYKPNAWGLYDMHGNVGELCLDWYAYNAYPTSAVTDPKGAEGGRLRSWRGGGWYQGPDNCCSSYRNGIYVDDAACNYIGLRLCCPAEASFAVAIDTRANDGRPTVEGAIDVCWSSLWSGDAEATATVTANGNTLKSANGEGAVAFTPIAARRNTLVLTTFKGGEAVGETLTATVEVAPTAIGDETVDGITYRYRTYGKTAAVYNGGEAAISGACDGEVAIPSMLGGCVVASIGENAFAGCGEIVSLAMPSGVKSIVEGALSGCTGLKTIVTEPGDSNRIKGLIKPALNGVSFVERNSSAKVAAEITGGAELHIDASWAERFPDFVAKFGDDFAAALTKKTGKKDQNGNDMFVWQDFVAGTDPTDPDSQFRASVEFVDGQPVVTWTPDLGGARDYKIYGKRKLGGDWWYDWYCPINQWSKFFKVKVSMPNDDGDADVQPDPLGDNPNLDSGDLMYAVIDLSAGENAAQYPVSYLSSMPDGGWTDEYKTTKLVLRYVDGGSFVMGSPSEEVGRDSDETQHQVTISKPFYIGVFEVTQKQWELVMGSNPSSYTGDTRPVESVSYSDIRGACTDANDIWPIVSTVDPTSFLGRLRARTGIALDLPTEAQWEYACRADTTTALNNGKNLTDKNRDDNSMNDLCRYGYNNGYVGGIKDGKGGCSDYHTAVGSYQPNGWGLYDMHGNVWEWCLDWYGSYPSSPVTDPKGATSGSKRVLRGGCWAAQAFYCRSAYRNSNNAYVTKKTSYGLRLCCPAGL